MTFYLIEGNIGIMHSLEKRIPVPVLVVNGPATSMSVVELLSEDCPFLFFRTSVGIRIAAAIRMMPTMDTRIQIRFLIRTTLELLEQAEHHLYKRLKKKANMYSVSRARDNLPVIDWTSLRLTFKEK